MAQMAGTMAGKVALITGAGQGVGLGIAQAMAAEGAAVVLAGRTAAKVEAAAQARRRPTMAKRSPMMSSGRCFWGAAREPCSCCLLCQCLLHQCKQLLARVLNPVFS